MAERVANGPVENVQRIMLSSSGGTQPSKVSVSALAKRVGADQAVMAPLGVRKFGRHHLVDLDGTNAELLDSWLSS